jgi:hypothetical protein
VREGAQGEREREILGGGVADGRGPQGGRRWWFQPPRAWCAWAAGGRLGRAGGLTGPPSRPKKKRGGGSRGWAASLAGPQGEGEGREGKKGFFPFLIYLLNE